MTATITTVEAWDHIVNAVLCSISDDEDQARRYLMLAERIMPVPDEAYRAVLDVEYEDPALETAHDLAETYRRDLESAELLAQTVQSEFDDLWQQHEDMRKALIQAGHTDLLARIEKGEIPQ